MSPSEAVAPPPRVAEPDLDEPDLDEPDLDDPDLGEALVDDLDAGFAALVRRHQGLLLTVALRTTGARPDAEDLAAEALLRAYRALRTYDAERIRALEMRPWLVTVLLNVRRNDARAAARRPGVSDRALPDRPAPGRTVEEQAGDPELADALATLPALQRAAVVLRHVADLPVVEVAAALGCPEGTVKSHVSRGLTRLRAALCDTSGRSTP